MAQEGDVDATSAAMGDGAMPSAQPSCHRASPEKVQETGRLLTKSITVTSGGENTLMGGPQVPEPLLV
jgi:hypothetical protein